MPAPTPAPGPVPAGSPISVLAVKDVTIKGDAASIAPAIRLVETGGRGDALVTSITFNLGDGPPWPHPVECAYGSGTRVKAGGESTILPAYDPYGDYAWSFSLPATYTGRLAVMISYADEVG